MEQITLQDILETAKQSFKFFMQAIIGYVNPPFLDELDDVISDEAYKKIIAAFPRGHGKSTHLSIGYPLWLMAQNHNIRILIVSNTSTSAQGFLRGILSQIEKNEKYKEWAKYIDPAKIGVAPSIRKVGHKVEEKWSGQAITIQRNDPQLKDPTIAAVGLFGAIVGKRIDVIIIDDIVDQQNSDTEEQRNKIKEWFRTTLLPVLVNDGTGRVIYLGNTWHMDDLVQDLLSDPSFDYKKKLKSIISESEHPELWQDWAKIRLQDGVHPRVREEAAQAFYETHKFAMDAGVQVLWPDRMPYGELYLKRMTDGEYAFARMYQCDPASKPDQKFQEKWLDEAKRKGKDLILQDAPREGLTTDITTSGLDLAISLEDSADETVLLTIDRIRYGNDVIHTGDVVIRNIRRGKMTPNTVRIMVKQHNDNVRPSAIRVESNQYQQSMVNDLLDMGQVNVRGYKTGGEKNDIEIGINSLAILAENGKLIIPYNENDPRTMELCGKLVNEMRKWPDGHTGDSLMALWLSVLELRDLTSAHFTFPTALPNPMNIQQLPPDERRTLEQEADIAAIKLGETERKSGKRILF